jgi:hypothetical protein
MSSSPIQKLLNTPPEELLAEWNRVREREQLIAQERELLERVLEILIENGGPAADWLTDRARGVLTIGPLRSQILSVMANEPARKGWLPRRVHEQLLTYGNKKASLDNVRTTMGRMAAAGELLQPDPSKPRFSLPPADLALKKSGKDD